MKEQTGPTQPELTINSNPPTLEVRGDIFMPEPGNPNQEPPIGKDITPNDFNNPELSSDQPLGAPRTAAEGAGGEGGLPPRTPETAVSPGDEENNRNNIINLKLIQDEEFKEILKRASSWLGNSPSKTKIKKVIDIFSQYETGDSRLETINRLHAKSVKEGKPKTLEQILAEHKGLGLTPQEVNQLKDEKNESERQMELILGSLREKLLNAPEGGPEDEDLGDEEMTREEIHQWVDTLKFMTSEEKITAIKKVLSKFSPQSQIPLTIIGQVVQFDETTEYLVNKIIAQPLDQETSHYQLSFYGSINLDQIKDKLKTFAETKEGGKEFQERYQEVLNIAQAVALFHEMNREIVTGNLEGFVNGSRGITPDQLQSLQEVKGASNIMRMMEGEFMRIASRDGYINDKNFEEMMGSRGVRTGKNPNPERIGSVEDMFRSQIKAGLREKMDEWEIKWALNSAKLLFNLSLRSAEQISLGKIQKGDRQYASIPQESAARLMNWLGWTGLRFEISPQRGGMMLVKMAQKNYQNERREVGYNDISLEKIGGRDITEYETAGMFGATGAFSGWRQSLIILEQIGVKINIPNLEKTFEGSLREYIEAANKEVNKGRHERFESYFLQENGVLRPEINSALGVILKLRILEPSHKDSKAMRTAKENVRRAIWEEAALNNPLAIAPLIHNSQRGGKMYYLTNDGTESTEEGSFSTWGSLTKKLNILQEIRMSDILDNMRKPVNERQNPKSLDQIIEEYAGSENGLTEDESAMLGRIRELGTNFAKDFANIRFPFNPFMNDVVFENLRYGEAGSQFYSRRMGSDLPSFYNSYNEFVKLMDNPGGTKIEDALTVLHAMVQAIGQPQGIEFAQDRVFPFLCAYLRFIEMGGQYEGYSRFMQKFLAIDGLKKIFKIPNSYAQQFSGMRADALNEDAMSDLLNDILDQGITRKGRDDENGWWIDLDDKLRKKFGLKLGGILLALFRDFSQIFVVSLIVDVGKKTGKDTSAG